MRTAIDTTTLMNRMYGRQRHIYDFTRKHYLLGRDELIARLQPGPSDSVLEIGCGTGRNLISAATRYSGTRFFGVDVSTAMLTYAIESVAHTGLSSRIRFAHSDATTLIPAALFGKPKFDRVFMSYTLSDDDALAGRAGCRHVGRRFASANSISWISATRQDCRPPCAPRCAGGCGNLGSCRAIGWNWSCGCGRSYPAHVWRWNGLIEATCNMRCCGTDSCMDWTRGSCLR